MRTRRAELEQKLIRAAIDFGESEVHQIIPYGTPEAAALYQAITDYTEHINTNLDGRGAFVPGVDTSENAALSYMPRAGSFRRRIIDEIRSVGFWSTNNWGEKRAAGLTDDELERRLRAKHTTVSSARNYLVEAGWLTDSGARRDTAGRRPAIVWQLTDAAKKIITSPEWLEATWK